MGEPSAPMQLVPVSVGKVAGSWDEQHLDVYAAARQIGQAAQGFSPAVATAARRFVAAWEQHADLAATRCEGQADGLRVTMADWIATDGHASWDAVQLMGYLEEVR